MPKTGLTVAVIALGREGAAILEEGLRHPGIARVVVMTDTPDLPQRIAEANPDVVVMNVQSPGRELLEHLFQVSKLADRPVAMFVDRSEASTMQSAVEAGISAYVVDGLKSGRVKAVIDLAVLRFDAVARLRRELSEAKSELAARKVVERAKGLLMKRKGISEEDAYGLLRRKAMNEKRKLVEIAEALVTSAELLD